MGDDVMKSDVGRCCLLFRYGGIYIDSDFEVFEDIHALLPAGRVSLVESPYKMTEELQNSLMASPKRHHFWKDYIKHVEDHFWKWFHLNVDEQRRTNAIFFTGPAPLTRVA